MKPLIFIPATVSGLLLWTAFFPCDLGPVGFVALVPWLWLVRAPISNKRRYFAAYVGGLAFFVPALNWLRVAHPMMYFSWAGLALACPIFWLLGLALIRGIDRSGRIPLAFSVPVVWVALEYLRAHFPTGFSFLKHVQLHQKIGFGWYFLGYTQHRFSELIQIADVGGVYAVSFLVAACNGAIADWLYRSTWVVRILQATTELRGSNRRSIILSSTAISIFFLASLGYGLIQLKHDPFEDGPRVAAIQGSVPQAEKNLKGISLEKAYWELHYQAAGTRPDLIVWPETCFPLDWVSIVANSTAPKEFEDSKRECDLWYSKVQWRASVLLGLNSFEWENGTRWRYNSALMLNPHGKFLGRYDKMHLVPFGEYVPLKETLPWMANFTPYDWDYSCRPGEHWTRFPLTTSDGRTFSFGCLICYEDSDPYLARQYNSGNDPVDFLVNISNDGWFDGTEEHEEHLAICRFRAIEMRRSIVRAVNMGISAAIDPDGQILALPAQSWAAAKKINAVVNVVVPIDHRISMYGRIGDWIPAGCWVMIVVFWITARFPLRKLSP